ncbi:MAG: hypothetical protein Q9209_007002 [Squamulea sp. 1 TL-2023]
MLVVRLHLKPASARLFLQKQIQYNIPHLRCTLFTTIRQYAVKSSKPASKTPGSYRIPPKPSVSPASSSYKSFNQTLADRSKPVLLYQAASHTIYIVGCYSIGLLIIGWIAHTASTINLIHTLTPNKYGVYLKIGYYTMIAMAGGVAMVFIMRPYRIIQSIQAVPVTLRQNQKTLHLQIESTRMFPGLKPKTVSIPVNDIKLSRPLFQERSSHNNPFSDNLEHRRRLEAEKLRKLREGNYLLLPFRQLGFHLSKGFQGLKDALTRNPFIYLRAKGFNGSWKLDKETGWALEDGRAIDRIIKSRMTL